MCMFCQHYFPAVPTRYQHLRRTQPNLKAEGMRERESVCVCVCETEREIVHICVLLCVCAVHVDVHV